MDAIECILTRVSVRAYLPDPLKSRDLDIILKAAVAAPSAGNRQPWKIYVVRDPSKRKILCEASYGQSFVGDAPVVLVIAAIPEESGSRYGKRGRELYCIQDTAAMCENILLAAHALGYGCCWVGAFDEGMTRKILDMPASERPVAILPIGVPARKSKKPTRKPMEKVVVYV